MLRKLAFGLAGLLVVGCGEGQTPRAGTSEPASSTAAAAATTTAKVGEVAPDFELADLDGNKVSLASFKGKTVVLEWFNPECPFVKRSHGKGSLKDLASKVAADDVVWLAINSGAPGKQGHGVETNRAGAKGFGMSHPVLLDESGAVGKLYGATNTPHMFVIDKSGKLAFSGAIDNSPDGEGESPEGGTLINYVTETLGALSRGEPVKVASNKAYGCSVKY